MADICKTCKFFKGGAQVNQGLCLRFPPMPMLLPTATGAPQISAQYPMMQNSAWCGEHRPQFSFDLPSTPTPRAIAENVQ